MRLMGRADSVLADAGQVVDLDVTDPGVQHFLAVGVLGVAPPLKRNRGPNKAKGKGRARMQRKSEPVDFVVPEPKSEKVPSDSVE